MLFNCNSFTLVANKYLLTYLGLSFCLDLSLSRSTDHRDRNLHSLSLEVRPTTLSFHLKANMYVFNVKSYAVMP